MQPLAARVWRLAGPGLGAAAGTACASSWPWQPRPPALAEEISREGHRQRPRSSFFGIASDSGDKALLHRSSYLRGLANPHEAFEEPVGSPKKRRLETGAAVEAFWPDKNLPGGGEWLPGQIIKVQPDGSMDVSWEGEDSYSTVAPGYVRSREV